MKSELIDALIKNELYFPKTEVVSRRAIKKLECLPKLKKDIFAATNFLDDKYDIVTRIRCIIQDIKKVGICGVCGNNTAWRRDLHAFSKFCSQKCSNMSDDKVELGKKNFDSIKMHAAYKKKIEVDPSLEEKRIQKAKDTNIRKYGCENVMFAEEIKAKHLDIVKEKNKKTGEWYRGNKHWHVKELESRHPKLFDKDFLIDQHHKEEKTIFQIAKEFGCNHSWLYNQYLKFEIEILRHKSTTIENFIQDYLTENNLSFVKCDRQIIFPKELDFYIPNHKIAIEVNGCYWHSIDRLEDKNYHIRKTIECQEKGITLIQIDDFEILTKPEIVISRLNSIFSKNIEKYWARKCTVKEITNKAIIKQFLEDNHIQGNCGYSSAIGLYDVYNNLLMVATFGKPRFNKNYDLELLRMCTKLNTSVVGGASKLLAFADKVLEYKNLISYADLRWGTGNVYGLCGFNLIGKTSPNYYYTSSSKKYSRYQCQKHKLGKLLGNKFNPDMSEMENMKNSKFAVVYDCGNNIWVKTK